MAAMRCPGMPSELKPAQIFERAANEGRRRLDQSLLQLTATGFIAGFTIVFGMIAMAIVDTLARPLLGGLAHALAALAFGLGVVFLIVGKAELFSENFFDPIAARFECRHRHWSRKVARLWGLTLILNLVGGAILVLVMAVDGAMPHGASESFRRVAEEIAARSWSAALMRAIVGGALVALLSFLVIGCRDTTGRILCAWGVGFLLALGPFDHVVVSLLHIAFGFAFGAHLDPVHVAEVGLMGLAGNVIGGIGLVTLSHVAQAKAAEDGRESG